jgi:hypothetical protein
MQKTVCVLHWQVYDVCSHGLVHCRLQIFQTWGKILVQQNFITPEFWCGSSLSGVVCFRYYVANTELVVFKRTVYDFF